jgi:tetratricopeptide (TPR) repeat protein
MGKGSGAMSDVFVSYARANEAEAASVTHALRALGYSVWRDDALPVHRAYGEVIEERLRAAKAVVVLWSEQAARSEWVRSEANRAREARKLVQLSIDGAGLPMPFDQIQCADLRGWTGDPDGWAWGRVVASVAALLNPGAQPSPVPARAKPPAEPHPGRHVQAPLPPRIAGGPAQGFVGRAAERAILQGAWTDASEGKRRVVLLGGEPGMGKTRLAAEMARSAHAEGATVLFGYSDEDVSLPYRPFIDAFRHYVAHASDAVLARHTQTHCAELARLAPDLRARLPDLPPPQTAEGESERFLLFEAAAGILAEAAKNAPVILVLDDLHWASASDLMLLKHIVRAGAPTRLLIIGTFRDTDIGTDHPLTALLADLRREEGVTRMSLTGVDEEAVRELVTASAGHDLGERGRAVAHALHRDTAGNPFFITEMLRNLAETGEIAREDQRWTYRGDIADLRLPDSVKEVIERRLGRLAPGTVRILGVGAVIGRHFTLDLLERAAADSTEAADPDALLDAIDEGVAAALIAEVPGDRDHYAFNHALVRMTLYEGLSGPRRRRMHRRIGETLEGLAAGKPGAFVDELAYHWLAGADAGAVDKALAYARKAGDKAARSLAYESAADYYQRALDLLSPPTFDNALTRCDLLLDLGGAQRSASNGQFRATMAEAAAIARDCRDARRLGLAALGSGHPGGLQWGNAVDPALVSLYTEALACLDDSETLLRVALMGQLATELRFGPERQRRHDLTAEAVEIARRSGNRLALARALSARIFAIEDPTTLAERLTITAELEALTEQLGQIDLGCLAASHRFDALLASGDAASAEQAMVRCERLAEQLRAPFFAYIPRLLRTLWALMGGAPDAELQAFATLQAGVAIGLPHAANIFGGHLFELRTRQGRLVEMIDTVRGAIESFPELSSFKAALAFSLCEIESYAEAREIMEDLARHDFEPPLDMNWATTIHMLSAVCWTLHDERAALALYPSVDAVADQVGMAAGVRCDGSLGQAAGILAACLKRWDDAERHFERALAVNRRIGARAAEVSTLRAYATLLVERNLPADAGREEQMIGLAEQAAEALGMAGETAKLQRLRSRLEAEPA